MKNSIIELNQKNEVTGRTYIKWVVHEIYDTIERYNENGISWKEQFVLQNIDSVKGMPICVEFIDWDKSEPFGHGMTNIIDDEPRFENSATVGYADKGYIDTVEVNGKVIRALIAEGYIYGQRYPNFVTWLKAKMYDEDFPETSVEICAKKNSGSNKIIYESGWMEKGRVPMTYDYTGDAILGIKPSDDSAILLELNNKIKDSKEENELTKELEKQVSDLTKQLADVGVELNNLRTFKETADKKNLITELNSKLSLYSEDEKSPFKWQIDSFSTEPTKEKMDSILFEINSSIVQKVIESRKNPKAEVNNKQDIYSDVFEANSDKGVPSITELY